MGVLLQLNEIQSQFKDMILGDYDDVLSIKDFTKLFDTNEIGLDVRLHIYRDNVLKKLAKVLEITYPTIHSLVGDEFFHHIAMLYACKYPPREGCVNLYGEEFSKFISEIKQTENLPYLYDVALYDWCFNAAFYAVNDEAIDQKTLKSISPEELPKIQFIFRSSVHLIESNYPLTSIREFCDPENEQREENLDINKGGEKLLVYRPDLEIQVVSLKNDEFHMLQCLQNKNTIERSLEKVMPSYPEFNFQEFLQKTFDLKFFLNIQLMDKQ